MLKPISAFVIFCSCFFFLQAGAQPDSIGVVKLNGETYMLYQVDRGETLYSISKKYKIKPDEIISANSYIKDFSISEGQIIKIPFAAIQAARKAKDSPNIPKAPDNTTSTDDPPVRTVTGEQIPDDEAVPVNENLVRHTVGKGETLYSLSKKFGVRVTEIVEWNDLSNYAIKEGQELVVGKRAPKEDNDMEANAPEPEDEDRLVADLEEDSSIPGPATTNEHLKAENVLSLQYKELLSANGKKESHRTGIATWISTSAPFPTDDGYYALHRDLPIGTVVKVKNLMNNRVIYAKVIGNLPNNSENEKLLIKLPQEAAKELNVLDARMMVEVSHLEAK